MSTTGSANWSLLADPDGDSRKDEAENLCMATMRSGGLDMIAQISGGVLDFVVDGFAERPPEGAEDVAVLRANCASAARLVTMFVDAQDGRLEAVRTGRLIRTVLHADGGAVFCYTVVPGQNVVAFVYARESARPEELLTRQPLVNRADHAITGLVNQLRQLLGLPTQNPGGWSSEGTAPPLAVGNENVLLNAAVNPVDLHYVARVRSGQAPEVADDFDHPEMRKHFRLITPAARRKFYEELLTELCLSVGQVGRLIRSTVGGSVQRMVLDVEQGAVVYYRIGVGDYLVGVTLSQAQVNATDEKLAALAVALASPPSSSLATPS